MREGGIASMTGGRSGRIPFEADWTLFYRSFGETAAGHAPVVCLHGGPGRSHDTLLPLARLAESGRQVILYDQLGCGRSSRPSNPELWGFDLALREIATLRAYFGFERIHLLGHSWGGMVAQEYAVTQPAGLISMVIGSCASDLDLYLQQAWRMRAKLGDRDQAVLAEHEATGQIEHPDYIAAYRRYLDLFTCKLRPLPAEFEQSAKLANPEISRALWGPGGNSFLVNGRLKGWSILDRLHLVIAPTLIIIGSDDLVTREIADLAKSHIGRSELHVVEGGSHTPFYEDLEDYVSTVSGFFDRSESTSRIT